MNFAFIPNVPLFLKGCGKGKTFYHTPVMPPVFSTCDDTGDDTGFELGIEHSSDVDNCMMNGIF